ncbi:hypothetical protein JDN40_14355 [Rhodomicrobium vannielii ATCC 17100]|uniref:hypothetical protein n=1 Tax=Rhodomicrobium vannielii TaxID=1069 RepID=UPI001917F3B1|nr:hypothetical protein [Rhodomicrobium vannielii]MBJ7535290.1 hypothetical protein [Rhodomicrobium vannielii ATCC 17100]
MTPAEILSKFTGGGFDALDVPTLANAAKQQLEGQITMAREEAEIARAMYRTPEGRRYIEWLIGKTLMRPPSEDQNSATTMEHCALLAKKREGQNSIVHMTLAAIRFAEGETKEMSHD